jgi:hypothetical protein
VPWHQLQQADSLICALVCRLQNPYLFTPQVKEDLRPLGAVTSSGINYNKPTH